ncbi:MAG: hypothetical protein FT671_03625 [Pantoea sp. Brub]|nr:hypothetical protein [Pantoea sp. Brub]
MIKKILLVFNIYIFIPVVLSKPILVDSIVAFVNEEAILKSELDDAIKEFKYVAYQKSEKLPDEKTLTKQVLNDYIMNKIIIQLGKAAGIIIPDDFLNKAIQHIADTNKISLEQLQKELTSHDITFDEYRKKIRDSIIINTVTNNEIKPHVVIFPQELNILQKKLSADNYKKIDINLSQILLSLPEQPSINDITIKKELAEKIINKLKKGDNFVDLARIYSDSFQASKDGTMGWSTIGEQPSLFIEKLKSAKEGDIIGPIKSGAGFHILKVNQLKYLNIITDKIYINEILLNIPSNFNDTQIYKILKKINNHIKQNKNKNLFKLIKDFSKNLIYIKKINNLGWMETNHFSEIFKNVKMNFKKGEISEVFKSPFGWKFIQILNTHKINEIDIIQKQQAYNHLFEKKFLNTIHNWIQEQIVNHYVNIIDDNKNS